MLPFYPHYFYHEEITQRGIFIWNFTPQTFWISNAKSIFIKIWMSNWISLNDKNFNHLQDQSQSWNILIRKSSSFIGQWSSSSENSSSKQMLPHLQVLIQSCFISWRFGFFTLIRQSSSSQWKHGLLYHFIQTLLALSF